MKICYQDMEGKSHYTNGEPVGVATCGFLHAQHLIVQRKKSVIYIPHYLLQDATIINQFIPEGDTL